MKRRGLPVFFRIFWILFFVSCSTSPLNFKGSTVTKNRSVAAGSAAASGGSSAAGSLGSLASVASFNYSLLASSMVFQAGSLGSAAAMEASMEAVKTSVALGSDIVLTSAKIVGEVVQIVLEVSLEGSKFASEVASNVVTITLEVSHSALEASFKAAGSVLDVMIDGSRAASRMVIQAVRIPVEASAEALGYSLFLSVTPLVEMGVILTMAGCQVYGPRENCSWMIW